jgi:ribosomal protein S27E
MKSLLHGKKNRNLRMKCSSCGHWNRVTVNKIFLEQPSPIDANKVKVIIPMYQPLEKVKCEKCSRTVVEPTELIQIIKRTVR